MKRTGLAVVILLLAQLAFAAFPAAAVKNDNWDSLPAATSINTLRLRSYERLTGQKLSFFQKPGIAWMNRQAKRKDRKPANIGLTRVGGFLLGFCFGLIGLAIAFLISKNKEFRKWSLIGVGALFVAAFVVLILMVSGCFPYH